MEGKVGAPRATLANSPPYLIITFSHAVLSWTVAISMIHGVGLHHALLPDLHHHGGIIHQVPGAMCALLGHRRIDLTCPKSAHSLTILSTSFYLIGSSRTTLSLTTERDSWFNTKLITLERNLDLDTVVVISELQKVYWQHHLFQKNTLRIRSANIPSQFHPGNMSMSHSWSLISDVMKAQTT